MLGITALLGMRNIQIDVYHIPPFWIFLTVTWYFRGLYFPRKNNFHVSCTPCQTGVNSKVPIDLNTPGLYFSFLSRSQINFTMGIIPQIPSVSLWKQAYCNFILSLVLATNMLCYLFFPGFKNFLAYENSFRGVVILNALLCISVCVYKHIHIHLWAAESKLCTTPLHFLILKLWALQSMFYSEWFSSAEYRKTIFKERWYNQKDCSADCGENCRKMCKHRSLKLLSWITDSWKLS